MTGVITGDIINSKTSEPQSWLHALKNVLNDYGKESKQWEVFRGDSFQLEIEPERALEAAILIKAAIKHFKNVDVRLAIGLGEKTYDSNKITESNGSAFVNSGECFEALKTTTLAIKSPFESFDTTLNIMLELILLTINHWTERTSKFIKIALENKGLNQLQLAKLLQTPQSNVSRGLKRAGYDEVLKLLNYYKVQVNIL